MLTGAIILLLPLLLLLRRTDDHRLDILQKCLLISLLIHVLLMMGSGFIGAPYALLETGLRDTVSVDVPVQLDARKQLRQEQLQSAIRSQSVTSDLPVPTAPPTQIRQPAPDAEPLSPAPVMRTPVPQARIIAHPLDLLAAASANAVRPIDPSPAATSPLEVHAPWLDLHPIPAPRVAQAEQAALSDALDLTVQKMPSPMASLPAPLAQVQVAPTQVAPTQALSGNIIAPEVSSLHPGPLKTDLIEIKPTFPEAVPAMEPARNEIDHLSDVGPPLKPTAPPVADITQRHTFDVISSARFVAPEVPPSGALPIHPGASPAAILQATKIIKPMLPARGSPQAVELSDLIAAPTFSIPRPAAVRVASGLPDAPMPTDPAEGVQPTTRPSIHPSLVAGSTVASGMRLSIAPVSAQQATPSADAIAAIIRPSTSSMSAAEPSVVFDPMPGPVMEWRHKGAPSSAAAFESLSRAPSAPVALTAEKATVNRAVGGAAAPIVPSLPAIRAAGETATAPLLADSTVRVLPPLVSSASGENKTPPLAGLPPTAPAPQLLLPKMSTAPTLGDRAYASSADRALDGGAPDEGPILRRREAGSAGPATPAPIQIASLNLPGIAPHPADAGAMTSAPGQMAQRPITPSITPAPPRAELNITPPRMALPPIFTQRAPDRRQPLIKERGGTQESERSVARGLAYLATQQEPDGRWTLVQGDQGKPGHRPLDPHDMAYTGLAALAFLAADHSPSQEGPYRATVSKGIAYLLAQQEADGDLRGPRQIRGGGSDRGNMYDHAIATMAVAEAAAMTGDRRYVAAAYRAADFIVTSQNTNSGGWRYLPDEPGDTSVLGWQLLALHDCQQLGYRVPSVTRNRAITYLRGVTSGRADGLACYQPGRAPDPVMTAEALFCRILLDQPISDDQAREASEYIAASPAQIDAPNLYAWYYASLSLSQLQNKPWQRWNVRTRDVLVANQRQDGAWDSNGHYDRGGRIYCTALATLTLEVYYRYLPLHPQDAGKGNPLPVPRRPRLMLEPS